MYYIKNPLPLTKYLLYRLKGRGHKRFNKTKTIIEFRTTGDLLVGFRYVLRKKTTK